MTSVVPVGVPAPARVGAAAQDVAAGVLVALTWAVVVAPRALQSVTAPKFRTAVGVEAAPYSSIALLADRGLTAMVVGACGLAVLLSLRRVTATGALTVAVLLLPWLVAAVRDAYAGTSPGTQAALYPLVVLALWALAPGLRVAALVGHLAGATALLAVVMGALLPRAGVYHLATGELVEPDKAFLPIGLLVGPFSDSNNLAQVLVLGAPALLLVRRRRVALAWFLVVVAATAWSGSRSSLLALAVAGAVVGVTALARRRGTATALSALGGALSLAVLVAVPLVTVAAATSGAGRSSSSDVAFTNRGYVWRLSLQAFADAPLTGLGTRWYGQVARYANPLGGFAYHGHNLLVQSLVTTGLIGTAALALVAVVALVRACAWAGSGVGAWAGAGAEAGAVRGAGALFPLAHLVALCLSNTFEVSFATVDRDFLLPVAITPLALWLLARRVAPPLAAAPPSPRVVTIPASAPGPVSR